MRTLHVKVEQGEKYLVAQALEEPGVITQGQTFDEIIANVRDAAELLLADKDIQIELLVPATIKARRPSKKTRAGKNRAA